MFRGSQISSFFLRQVGLGTCEGERGGTNRVVIRQYEWWKFSWTIVKLIQVSQDKSRIFLPCLGSFTTRAAEVKLTKSYRVKCLSHPDCHIFLITKLKLNSKNINEENWGGGRPSMRRCVLIVGDEVFLSVNFNTYKL